ncbi:MAG: M16 family metallopeptidase [Bacteroidia bacterium]
MLKIPFQTFTLSNGLKVIVNEDHTLPKVVLNVLYHVGSKDEEAHRTGFAHLFEHLMFEGSKHIPHYDAPLQQAGGTNNAFTSCDITNYYLELPSNQVETAFWLESDRMLELDFSEEKLAIQKSVVIEEFKQRYLNQPYGDAMNLLRGLAFQTHPYQWATIGKEIAHIEDATLQDVKDFFFGYYAPNNATLVVSGDISLAEAERLAKKWFEPIPNRALKKHKLPQEPKQTGARFMETKGDVPFIGIYKMYHIPEIAHRDHYVLEMLCFLLTNGKAAKLYQSLVQDQQIATSVSAFSWGMADPGVLSLNAQLAENKSIEEYEKVLSETLANIQSLTEDDLIRTKNKFQAGFLMEKMTLLNNAMGLAWCDFLGDINLYNEMPNIYESITLKDIKTCAAKYFDASNCSTLYYLPK